MASVRAGEREYKKVEIAESFYARLKGLLGRKELDENEGLIITKCNSIHSFFMKFDIDVLFIDEQNRVKKIIRNMKPWRMSWICFGATKVFEVKGGTMPESVKEGQTLQVVENV